MVFIFMIFVSLHDRSKDVEMDAADYLLINNISDVNFKNNERIKYYDDNDIGGLFFKQKIEKSEYTIMRFPQIGEIQTSIVIENFPKKIPKFFLVKNAR